MRLHRGPRRSYGRGMCKADRRGASEFSLHWACSALSFVFFLSLAEAVAVKAALRPEIAVVVRNSRRFSLSEIIMFPPIFVTILFVCK